MKLILTTALIFALVAPSAFAEKIGNVRLDRTAGKLCPASIYEHSVEGVFFEGNKQMLAFRISWDSNENACYGWLNKQPKWGINQAGSTTGKVRKSGNNLRFEDPNIVVIFNQSTGGVEFLRRNSQRKTPGRLISR